MNAHIPVMLPEVCGILEKAQNLRFVVDATLGLGGYSEGVLLKWRNAVVLGIDQDPQAIEAVKRKLMDFGDRFRAVHGNFRDLSSILVKTGMGKPDAVLFDLGVSSFQIDTPERGFSFQENGPLDMRMDSLDERRERAGDIINTAGMRELITLFRKYGEDPYAAQIARGIVRYRESSGPIKSTSELVQVIRDTLPAPVQRKMGRNPARKVFQALRIAVNDELEALTEALNQCETLAAGAMMVIVVSYHSLEDRIVKRRFREWAALGRGNDLFRKPLVPGAEELRENWRSRSAKLRAFSFQEKPAEVTDP
ncbi:MAG: 16S rRNA (cytosine(1402)-N(4))-methyltransferase RsmH [Thermovirgaceae bacterium]|nr:16S rRNA (cytosine(1402)-N(4))-methyltransferase RsmH [Synergistales bacterium]HPC75086.1 16S rRNA (cytosine(1402)-N(4))-methyltransferase RsmH [Synergistales bacterium]HRS48442.1 16S rRNA (cytosine(1402)-N(4))-methyltransferase RsmH [Thermovirgaceae bacterium]HRU90328.1 16S rRNA (cytosine(1402)-N(4))-methyltransferase RsmH [Thermovirgaceae bacterium]